MITLHKNQDIFRPLNFCADVVKNPVLSRKNLQFFHITDDNKLIVTDSARLVLFYDFDTDLIPPGNYKLNKITKSEIQIYPLENAVFPNHAALTRTKTQIFESLNFEKFDCAFAALVKKLPPGIALNYKSLSFLKNFEKLTFKVFWDKDVPGSMIQFICQEWPMELLIMPLICKTEYK